MREMNKLSSVTSASRATPTPGTSNSKNRSSARSLRGLAASIRVLVPAHPTLLLSVRSDHFLELPVPTLLVDDPIKCVWISRE